jgi:hypothetical protein
MQLSLMVQSIKKTIIENQKKSSERSTVLSWKNLGALGDGGDNYK